MQTGLAFPAVAAGEPAWFSSNIGRAEIVLPGFSPIQETAGRIALGANRTYDWQRATLPREVRVAGNRLVGPMQLLVRSNGKLFEPEIPLRVLARTDHHVELEGRGVITGGLELGLRARVEYDGVAVVDVAVTSPSRAVLEGLYIQFAVAREAGIRVMGFEPRSMYNYRPYFTPECYRGAYRSALGFVQPESSFWWFTDEMSPALLGEAPVTEIRCSPRTLDVRQPLVARAQRIDAPLRLRFAFLATPVRADDGNHRRERYAASPAAAEGNRHLWWIDATAHYALPALDLSPAARARLPDEDLRAYPGAARNRRAVAAWRSAGLERLPYVSQRSLSFLDPVIGANEERWQVVPEIETVAASDSPYRVGKARAILSLRGPGFSNYLLTQLDAVADGLGVRGFYFDQASPAGSTNPAQRSSGQAVGTWVTDILAMRDFYKRLATLLYQKGAEPLIYAHNSSAPIVPAFTFVTAMVQGEELIPEIRDLDYQRSFELARIRATYSPVAFGVPTVWLEELWSQELVSQRPGRLRSSDTQTWLTSGAFRERWRNYMALALLHDIPVWTQAPLADRREVFRTLDRFGIADSRFVGYWRLTREPDGPVLVSAWVHRSSGAVLLVLANRGTAAASLTSADINSLVDVTALSAAGDGIGRTLNWGAAVRIAPRDFLLLASR
jgi:hypothetical protein